MTPVIYMRTSLAEEEEKQAAARYFPVVERRTAIPIGSLVIPRYSALPYNEELEDDVHALRSKLINSHAGHVYVANLQNWYCHLVNYTPHTWFALDQIPNEGPFVLKGATNSMKNQWSTCMFAKDKAEAVQVFTRLTTDGYVGHQPIYIRQYVPLRKLCDPVSPQAAPICEEYRFFVLDGEVLTGGFYWSGYQDDLEQRMNPSCVPISFLQAVIDKVKDYIRFFVIDVARTAAGGWIVVELNDGQMSGLSAVDPCELYSALLEKLTKR